MKSDFRVKRIKDQFEYSEWLLKKHYAHRIPSISYAYGLYQDNTLKGVCTFGMPASHQLCIGIAGDKWKASVLELNRLVIDCDEPNIASWFIARCFKYLIKPSFIVSYADTAQGHIGKIYQACNFMFTGTTKERTDIDSGEGKHSRHYDKTQDYTKNRKHRSAKHRYIMILATKDYKRKMLKDLKYPICEYPKGDTQRYDASYQPITQGILF